MVRRSGIWVPGAESPCKCGSLPALGPGLLPPPVKAAHEEAQGGPGAAQGAKPPGWEPAAGSGQVGCGEPAGAGGSSEGQTPVTPASGEGQQGALLWGPIPGPACRPITPESPSTSQQLGKARGLPSNHAEGIPRPGPPHPPVTYPPLPPDPPSTRTQAHLPSLGPMAPPAAPLSVLPATLPGLPVLSSALLYPHRGPGARLLVRGARHSACHLPLPVGGSVPPAVSGQWTDTPVILN